MRTLSRRMRSRTSFLVSARKAPQISFSRPSNWAASFSAADSLDPVELGLALLLAGDGQRGGQLVADRR